MPKLWRFETQEGAGIAVGTFFVNWSKYTNGKASYDWLIMEWLPLCETPYEGVTFWFTSKGLMEFLEKDYPVLRDAGVEVVCRSIMSEDHYCTMVDEYQFVKHEGNVS